MEFDYVQARATAEKIISKFGVAGSVIKKGVAGGSDEWGDPIADIPDTVISGIITPVLSFKSSEIDGENIKQGDGYVFFHSETEPEIDMQTTVNSKTWRIIGIPKLDSASGINVYRKLHLRS
jgi:hypothetical protein